MLLTLVRQARRRLIRNDLLSQGANAFCAALFAFILLLLLGTQILDWRWAALIPLAAAGAGIGRTWRQRPTPYTAAQIVDHRLLLADTLSTAYYYSEEDAGAKVSGTIRSWQYSQAERVAETVDLRAALPYRLPRAVYAMLPLFLVATSLFALRYGLTHRLDLKPPLARILDMNLGGEPDREAAARRKNAPRPPVFQDEQGLSLSDQESREGDRDPASANALEPSEEPDVDNSKATQSKASARSKGEEGDQIAGDDQEGQSEDAQSSGGENNGEGQQSDRNAKDGQKSAADQQSGSPGENSSLMQKFKEAMQNLLSKMKQQPNGAGRQQSSQMAQNGKQGKQQQSNGKQNGGQGQKQQGAGQDADSQDGQPGDDAQSSQDSQAKGSGDSNEQQANKQPGSGIGKQDGSKDLKLAEQMAAMGKISELIGKRSANLSGEAMVEVENTSQQLSTRYEGRQATHGEDGAEINRDEVPVALQGYVQQYFEQVRKQAAGKK